MADIIPFPSQDHPPLAVRLDIICHSADHIEFDVAGLDTANDHDMLNLAGLLEHLSGCLYRRYGGKEEQ